MTNTTDIIKVAGNITIEADEAACINIAKASSEMETETSVRGLQPIVKISLEATISADVESIMTMMEDKRNTKEL